MADDELFPGKYILKACIPTNDALRALGENMPALPQLHRPGAVLDQMNVEEGEEDDGLDDSDVEPPLYPYWENAQRPSRRQRRRRRGGGRARGRVGVGRRGAPPRHCREQCHQRL